jgi:hypothetical protein
MLAEGRQFGNSPRTPGSVCALVSSQGVPGRTRARACFAHSVSSSLRLFVSSDFDPRGARRDRSPVAVPRSVAGLVVSRPANFGARRRAAGCVDFVPIASAAIGDHSRSSLYLSPAAGAVRSCSSNFATPWGDAQNAGGRTRGRVTPAGATNDAKCRRTSLTAPTTSGALNVPWAFARRASRFLLTLDSDGRSLPPENPTRPSHLFFRITGHWRLTTENSSRRLP